jgi:hypothetical protein
MHTFEMKEGIQKKQGGVHIVKMSVDKVTLIPLTHVIQPSFESDGFWIVRSQYLANVAYKVIYMFIEYASCTYEWAL